MRPTTSKVKLAIVSMLGGKLVQGSRVLDLFAGTGSVGIELSKLGAKKVVMIEQNNRQCSEIEERVKSFNANSFEIKRGNVFSVLPKLNSKFDIIFADPPYESNYFHKLTELIDKPSITTQKTLFIYEHFKKDETPEYFGTFKKLRDKTYGDSRISIFKKGEVASND